MMRGVREITRGNGRLISRIDISKHDGLNSFGCWREMFYLQILCIYIFN